MNWREKVLDFDNIGDRGEGLKGLVFDVQKFAIHDGGGIRTLVFLKGCPLHCLWCANPESLAGRPEITFVRNNCIACGECFKVCKAGALSRSDEHGLVIDRKRCTLCGECARYCYAGAINIIGRYVTVPELMAMVERDRKFYTQSNGGVTFSGGEPTAQPEFLKAALAELQNRGIHTAMETCSFLPWDTYAAILQHLDLVLTDIKHMDEAEHQRLTGVSNRPILDNLRQIAKLGIPVRIRLPLIPGCNDSEQNLRQTADFVEQLSNVQSFDILPYHRLGETKWSQLGRPYPLAGKESATIEYVEDRVRCIRDRDFKISVGG
jgi:pyruvate formate lyase activating enzyme